MFVLCVTAEVTGYEYVLLEPKAAADDTKLPLIVFPHGESQLLTTLGEVWWLSGLGVRLTTMRSWVRIWLGTVVRLFYKPLF